MVLGVDLSPIQPDFVPPNCRFEVDDITKDWTYQENEFDFVHIRGMTGCVPDWVELHKQARRLVTSFPPSRHNTLTPVVDLLSPAVG